MKPGIISKFQKIALARKLVTRALAIVSSILAVIIFLTFYGTQVGNFVIVVEGEYEASVALSATEDYSDSTSRLIVDTSTSLLDADYGMIPTNIEDGIGNKNDDVGRRYFAYSFYLINTGSASVDYEMTIDLKNTSRSLDSAIRIMIIKDGVETVYAKAQEKGDHPGEPELVYADNLGNVVAETVPFLYDGNVIVRQNYEDLEAHQVHKYTVIMWIDGWDLDEADSMIGGAFNVEMNFTIQ